MSAGTSAYATSMRGGCGGGRGAGPAGRRKKALAPAASTMSPPTSTAFAAPRRDGCAVLRKGAAAGKAVVFEIIGSPPVLHIVVESHRVAHPAHREPVPRAGGVDELDHLRQVQRGRRYQPTVLGAPLHPRLARGEERDQQAVASAHRVRHIEVDLAALGRAAAQRPLVYVPRATQALAHV